MGINIEPQPVPSYLQSVICGEPSGRSSGILIHHLMSVCPTCRNREWAADDAEGHSRTCPIALGILRRVSLDPKAPRMLAAVAQIEEGRSCPIGPSRRQLGGNGYPRHARLEVQTDGSITGVLVEDAPDGTC